MSIRLGIHSSALCPGPSFVGEPKPRKLAIDLPTLLTPSTTHLPAFLIPPVMFDIKLDPHDVASPLCPVKNSFILPNTPVMLSQIPPQTFFIPSHIFVKKPLIPSHTLLKILPIVSPTLPKNEQMFSPKPLINSQIPRNMFLIPDHILLAKLCIYSQAADQSPRSSAHTILIISSIALTTSITAIKNGPSASIIAPSTLDTTPHKVITSPPINSKIGFNVSYNSHIVSHNEANSVFSFSHIGFT